MADEVERLRREIERKTLELDSLKLLLAEKEEDLRLSNKSCSTVHSTNLKAQERKERLTNSEISRYSRQLILPEFGVKGQINLCNTSVLIVGAGGLGCPAALYLAAAGVGCIGVVDYDSVEISNLHRQVIHTESRVNVSKAESVREELNQLNSSVICVPYNTQLTSSNALEIIEKYDIVLDATDNVATRYLLNDACVMAKKPLVSGSALRFEGQLTVYNCDEGPCYRCLFPSPPPPDSVGNCSDTGVLGPVPGVIGTLQALEAIKIASGIKSSYSQKMLIYDALDGRFLTIKLRPKQANCAMCGDKPTIHELQDYEAFCGASATDKTPSLKLLDEKQRISVQEYKQIIDVNAPHVLLDVREPVELEICSLPDPINIPLRSLHSPDQMDKLRDIVLKVAGTNPTGSSVNVFVLCRQGNDSQKAVKLLRDKFQDISSAMCNKEHDSFLQQKPCDVVFMDIVGGLHAWAKLIDTEFPVY